MSLNKMFSSFLHYSSRKMFVLELNVTISSKRRTCFKTQCYMNCCRSLGRSVITRLSKLPQSLGRNHKNKHIWNSKHSCQFFDCRSRGCLKLDGACISVALIGSIKNGALTARPRVNKLPQTGQFSVGTKERNVDVSAYFDARPLASKYR